MEWIKKLHSGGEEVNPKEMIALEEELNTLREQYGIQEKKRWWVCVGDALTKKAAREPVSLNRSRYLKMALSCGWLCGAHRFYSRRRVLGILYLLFCWTGIPMAMTLVDCMIALPMKADHQGNILL